MVRNDENEEATLLNRTNGGGPTIAPSKLYNLRRIEMRTDLDLVHFITINYSNV